jgi:hypothetical protein
MAERWAYLTICIVLAGLSFRRRNSAFPEDRPLAIPSNR